MGSKVRDLYRCPGRNRSWPSPLGDKYINIVFSDQISITAMVDLYRYRGCRHGLLEHLCLAKQVSSPKIQQPELASYGYRISHFTAYSINLSL
jgi:hypothetical protein